MKIVFFGGIYDYWRYYMENAQTSYDVYPVYGNKIFTKSPFLRYLWNKHKTTKLLRNIPLPLKSFWCPRMIPISQADEGPITFIIYTSFLVSLPFSPKSFIRYLRKKYYCKIAIMFGNTVNSEKRFFDCESLCPMADLVCSYNTEDFGKYQIQIHPPLVFGIDTNNVPLSERGIDVFFIGQEKGRGKEINSIYTTLTKYGLVCDFYIVGRVESEKIKGIHYSDTMIPYSFVVEKLKRTRCVLNLLWKESQGVTLRDIEAYNNGCFIMKNFTDESIYRILHQEQVLMTADINENMVRTIQNAENSFLKKGEQNSIDIFYNWIIEKSWK